MSNTVEANAREVHALEFLAGLDCQLVASEEHLEARLKSIPDGWRKYRLARKTLEWVLDALYPTFPDKTLIHMQRLCKCGEVVIRPKPMVRMPDDVQIVPTRELKVLINKTISAECAMCLRHGKEVKRCELRKTLNLIAPPDAQRFDGNCPYRDVACSCELGEYI